VRSIVYLLREEIGLKALAEKVKKPLTGLRVGTHIGCHMLHEIREYDDPKKPRALKDLVRVLGAEVVDYPSELMCCASFARPMDEVKALGAVDRKMMDLWEAGADLLTVVCPSCYMQYELGQIEAARRFSRSYKVPVLYYTQLLGLAMGFSPEEMGINLCKVKPEKLLSIIRQT